MNISKIKFSNKQLNQFKKMGIETIYLFGSQAQGFTHPLSDVDLGVVFENFSKIKENIFSVYGELFCFFAEELEIKEKDLDLVFLQETPFSLQYKAITKGKILYCRNSEFLADYKEYVFNRYFDFLPVKREFDQALLSASLSV